MCISCRDTSGLALKVANHLAYNKVVCMSHLCRFFVQTVPIMRDFIRLNTHCVCHNYNDVSKVCDSNATYVKPICHCRLYSCSVTLLVL